MDKQEVEKYFKVGEKVLSGGGTKFFEITKITDINIRIKPTNAKSPSRLRYDKLQVLYDNFEKVNPNQIEKTVGTILTQNNLFDSQAESYLYGFIIEYRKRKKNLSVLSIPNTTFFNNSPQFYLENCVYTIKHSEDIDELLSSTRQGTFREYRNWSGAKKLFEIAQSSGKQLIILFAPAENTWLIHSWAIITDIIISDDRIYTDYSFDNLKKFEIEFSKTELILQNTDKNIDPNFIKPYAICKTPYVIISNEIVNNDPLSGYISNLDANNIEDILLNINEKMKSLKPDIIETLINKSIRKDSKIVQLLKQRHNYQCQYPGCKAYILMKNGNSYVEVAHIRPFSQGGKSVIGNLLVLCPNHHKEFDFGNLAIIKQDESFVEGHLNGNYFKIKCY